MIQMEAPPSGIKHKSKTWALLGILSTFRQILFSGRHNTIGFYIEVDQPVGRWRNASKEYKRLIYLYSMYSMLVTLRRLNFTYSAIVTRMLYWASRLGYLCTRL
jgi:hypothetical protein